MPRIVFACLLAVWTPCSADTHLGKPLTLNQPVTVDRILASPASWTGKTVQVTGRVTEVCQMAGCWMQLAGSGSNGIRIKVNDGDMVFPASAVGKTALAEGKLTRIALSREQALAAAKHEAEERNVKFEPASVKSGTVFYQIAGTGALIPE